MKLFKNVMVRTGVISGLVAGAMGIVLFLALYSMGVGIMDPLFRVDFWIPLPFLIFSLYYFRKRSNELRIWQGLLIGAVTVCVSAVLYISFLSIFMTVIDANYLPFSVSIRIAEIDAMKVLMDANVNYKEEFVEQYPKLLNAAKSLTVFSILFYKLLWHLFAGVLYTIFMSLLFRK